MELYSKSSGIRTGRNKKKMNNNHAYMVGVRLYIAYKVSQYFSRIKLAELYGISFKQLTNWIHRFEKKGPDGLYDKKGHGQKSLLSAEQLQRLELLILTESTSTLDILLKNGRGQYSQVGLKLTSEVNRRNFKYPIYWI